jgi:hypothetical protein
MRGLYIVWVVINALAALETCFFVLQQQDQLAVWSFAVVIIAEWQAWKRWK